MYVLDEDHLQDTPNLKLAMTYIMEDNVCFVIIEKIKVFSIMKNNIRSNQLMELANHCT